MGFNGPASGGELSTGENTGLREQVVEFLEVTGQRLREPSEHFNGCAEGRFSRD